MEYLKREICVVIERKPFWHVIHWFCLMSSFQTDDSLCQYLNHIFVEFNNDDGLVSLLKYGKYDAIPKLIVIIAV